MADEPIELVALEEGLAERLLQPGTPCLVRFADNTFLVDVLESDDEQIRVSFHAYDFPVPGMLVDLEFHEPEGIVRFVAKVLKGPKSEGDGILLERPFAPHVIQHRATYRVPTSLDGTFMERKGRSHESCTIKNLSTTGASLESRTSLKRGSIINITLQIDGRKHEIETKICHVAAFTRRDGSKAYVYGTRFVNYSPGSGTAVTNFVWSRLKELYPTIDTD